MMLGLNLCLNIASLLWSNLLEYWNRFIKFKVYFNSRVVGRKVNLNSPQLFTADNLVSLQFQYDKNENMISILVTFRSIKYWISIVELWNFCCEKRLWHPIQFNLILFFSSAFNILILIFDFLAYEMKWG